MESNALTTASILAITNDIEEAITAGGDLEMKLKKILAKHMQSASELNEVIAIQESIIRHFGDIIFTTKQRCQKLESVQKRVELLSKQNAELTETVTQLKAKNTLLQVERDVFKLNLEALYELSAEQLEVNSTTQDTDSTVNTSVNQNMFLLAASPTCMPPPSKRRCDSERTIVEANNAPPTSTSSAEHLNNSILTIKEMSATIRQLQDRNDKERADNENLKQKLTAMKESEEQLRVMIRCRENDSMKWHDKYMEQKQINQQLTDKVKLVPKKLEGSENSTQTDPAVNQPITAIQCSSTQTSAASKSIARVVEVLEQSPRSGEDLKLTISQLQLQIRQMKVKLDATEEEKAKLLATQKTEKHRWKQMQDQKEELTQELAQVMKTRDRVAKEYMEALTKIDELEKDLFRKESQIQLFSSK